jgi:hypothetical protein
MLRIVGGAVVFSILLAIQAKIQQFLCSRCENSAVSGFEAAILDSWIALIELQCFIDQAFSGNVLKALLLTKSGSEVAEKRWVVTSYEGYSDV